jgi:uncharacterized protein (TIGR04255 family)
MSEIRKLDKPPIKEAVIEFQFQPLIDFEKEDLIELYKNVKDNYNEQKFLEQLSFRMEPDLSPKMKDDIPPQVIGTILKDESRGFIVQFKRDRLAVSKLKPYYSFDELEKETFIFYSLIKKFIKDKNISRIGVRYINEINYIKEYLDIFEENPLNDYNKSIKEIKRFYNQSIFEHSINESTLLNLVIDKKLKQIVIDIDSYQLKPNKVDDIKKISHVLNILRERKNSIFFKIVSQKIEEVL